MRTVLLMVSLAMIGACSMTEGEQACNDLIVWTSDAVYRCESGTPEKKAATRAAAESQLTAQLGCDDAIGIRDKADFYGCCSDWFKTVACDEFLKGMFPACCKGQILK